MIRFKVYTRESEADPEIYPAGLAGSIHFAYFSENGEEMPLNKNYGIIFIKGEISPEDTIVPMSIRNPGLLDLHDGTIGIYADICHEYGEPVQEYSGKVFLWKTTENPVSPLVARWQPSVARATTTFLASPAISRLLWPPVQKLWFTFT